MDESIVDWIADLNPESLTTVTTAVAEPSLRTATVDAPFQFERVAFFVCDKLSNIGDSKFVFNRTVSLKESIKSQSS